MAGIISYGIYIPRYRLTRETILSAMGWFNAGGLPGEKAVANYDEDSLTMAVAASMDCLKDGLGDKVDALSFASTTAPYRERESAAIIATALDFPPRIRTADFAQSLKAGTGALLSACDSVKAGGNRTVLVCAADCRLAKPGGSQEMIFGDGAGALLIGDEKVMANLEASFSLAYDFPDHWRAAGDRFDRALEERWIRDEGYTQFISQAITGLLEKTGLKAKDVAKVIYPSLYARDHAAIAKKLGFGPSQVQQSLLETVGDPGTATPLVMLSAALEEAKAGDRLLVASYGSGSEALLFLATDEIGKMMERGKVARNFTAKKQLPSYEKYLAIRGILPVELGFRGEVGPTHLPVAWRERSAILALRGSRCQRCGTPQYPPQKICVEANCRAMDQMESYRFADKRGILFSYTEDRLAASLSPPQLYGVVDFEGGGRSVFDITDCDPGSLKVGTPVKMSLRRKYVDEVRGIHGYFWKATSLDR